MGPWGSLASQPSLLGMCQAKSEALFKNTRWMVCVVMLAFSIARDLAGCADQASGGPHSSYLATRSEFLAWSKRSSILSGDMTD